MFPKMRRSAQQMTEACCRAVLERNTSGVLSVTLPNGYPYGVPLSYCLMGDTLYFHGAAAGAKMDALRHSGKACFTVIDRDEVVPEKFSTRYRSVIVFGDAQVVTEEEERQRAIRALGWHYCPNASHQRMDGVVNGSHFAVIALHIRHISGKTSKE